MTPDELRRLDVDQCIIYEKGIKPIKAAKYYYFKYATAKKIQPFAVDHNTRENIDRGKWRKYNPYNPYVEESEDKKEKTKIEQLDDLFSDDISETDTKQEEPQTEMPVGLPMEPEKPKTEEEIMDIQKELEAKFDELFGSLNDAD